MSEIHPRKLRTQRIISVFVISLISFAGLESLVYINNLYQNRIYILSSIYFYLFLVFWLHFIFDLHLKEKGLGRSITHSIYLRFKHFLHWHYFFRFQNYMILPAIIYWGSVIIIGINFGHAKLQHFIAVASSIALVVVYTLFKEIFHSKLAPVYDNHFILLTHVKLYASWLTYASSLGVVWYYCLPATYFYLFIFLVTFLLLYQALFQFCGIKPQYITRILLISMALAFGSYFVYEYWNVNYFSAGLFLTAIYNLLWGVLFHSIKNSLTKEVFFEHLAIFALIVIMVFGVTNFRERIDRCDNAAVVSIELKDKTN
jgi:hypothetical protein